MSTPDDRELAECERTGGGRGDDDEELMLGSMKAMFLSKDGGNV